MICQQSAPAPGTIKRLRAATGDLTGLGDGMILHVDMDAFYASVEERERPELVGKPLIVGGTPEGRGVVAAANYAVRKFGVHSAMPAATALRLCPAGHRASAADGLLRPRLGANSRNLRPLHAAGRAAVTGRGLSRRRRQRRPVRAGGGDRPQDQAGDPQPNCGLTASVGVAPNKFLAKIASDLDKPDGFVVVDAARVQEFLDPLPVGRLWGVGRVAGQALERMGVRTIRDLRLLAVELLERQFGQTGQQLWQLAHGVDQRRVVPDREAKSISHETTFATDLEDMDTLRAWIVELAEQVGWRLRRHKLRGRTVQIKVRFDDFQTVTRAQTLAEPTNVTQEICAAATAMLAERLPKRRLRVRLLGVGVSHFENSDQIQASLFADEERQRQSRLDEAADQVKLRFGIDALQARAGCCAMESTKERITPDKLQRGASMQLRDRTAIVTGAASGLGKEIARTFAAHGAKTVVADLDAQGAETAAAEIRQAGHEALAVAIDVADEGRSNQASLACWRPMAA